MNIAILLAGGVGSRMKMGSLPKQFIMINDKPIISHCLVTFNNNENIDGIVIVCSPEYRDFLSDWIGKLNIDKFMNFADPGENRQYSIINALDTLEERNPENIIIHDSARPLVSHELINKCLSTLENNKAVMPVLPAEDTFYYSEHGTHVDSLLKRSTLFRGQAPEAFNYESYLKANRSLTHEELLAINGSSEVAVKCGIDVALIDGDKRNFKITTADDLDLFKTLCDK